MCEYGTDNVTCPNCPDACTGQERDAAADLTVCNKATKTPWSQFSIPVNTTIEIMNFEISESTELTNEDWSFITTARTALPYWLNRVQELQAEVEHTRAENAVLRGALEKSHGWGFASDDDLKEIEKILAVTSAEYVQKMHRLRELSRQAAEEIENCYGRETELSREIRKVLGVKP